MTTLYWVGLKPTTDQILDLTTSIRTKMVIVRERPPTAPDYIVLSGPIEPREIDALRSKYPLAPFMTPISTSGEHVKWLTLIL